MTTESTFATLSLPEALQKALDVLGFHTPTPIQAQATPMAMAGHDVIAQAQTGSGKTIAFGLAILARVDLDVPHVQALVLVPTRELATQVSDELRRLARFMPNLRIATLCGGVSVRAQVASLQTPPHIVVGTPGRIGDHLKRETIDLSTVRVFVLDEADRMLDMGFRDAIMDIAAYTPGHRQSLLWSATFPDDIRALSAQLQRSPRSITVETDTKATAIDELFFEVEPTHKVAALTQLLLHHRPERTLVFCHTRNDVRDLTSSLIERGFAALALHGELEQRERDEVLLRFANHSCTVLVATDVAARGLDIKALPLVVSWELPLDIDTHTHRIGRTGRAGDKGLAWTLFSRREADRLRAIESARGGPCTRGTLPSHSDAVPAPAPMVTLIIDGGKRDKLRPGDIVGALTHDIGVAGDAVGKITVTERRSYVAIAAVQAPHALAGLRTGKIKNRSFRASLLR